MANTRSERSIDSSIPAAGRSLLADITADRHWADGTLQYYLGGASALGFDSEFSSSIPRFFNGGQTDSSFAYVPQTVRAFDMIDSVIATDFTRVTNESTARNQADLVVVTHRDTNTGLEGFFNFPGDQTRSGNDHWSLGVFNSGNSLLNASPERGGGEYLYWTVIHEIGHGLGILHTHQERSGLPALTSVGEGMNNERYSVMSYNGATNANSYGHAVSLMALDIAALQQQYGAESYATGNSAYTLFDARGADLQLNEGDVHIGRAYFTIWDSGGTDTINYGSSSNSVLINLNDATLDRSTTASDAAPSMAALQNTNFFNALSSDLRNENISPDLHAGGFFSRVLTQSGQSYSGIDGGFAIAHGADIENAVGGAQEDLLIGNELGNRLTGAGGNDVLIGGGGNDTLEGGAGQDIAAYAGNRSNYNITEVSDGRYNISGGSEGTDVLVGVEQVRFDNTLLDLSTIGPQPGINRTGTAAADRLLGTVNNDTLTGLDGNDTLIGLEADDTLNGGNGNDLLAGDATENGGSGGGSAGRLSMGNGFMDFSQTVMVPSTIRANYVATRVDSGFSLAQDSDIESSTTIPHLTGGYQLTNSGYVYLAVDLVAGERFIVDVDYLRVQPDIGIDGYLRMYAADGALVAFNDDSATSNGGTGSTVNRDPYLDLVAEETGTFYIELSAYVRSELRSGATFEINYSQAFDQGGGGNSGNSVTSSGNDSLLGGAGNDTLEGGDGADTLNGGEGHDLIMGGATTNDLRDVVYGRNGNDTIDGGYGNDELRGDDGNDLISGGFGADTVIGGNGDDTVTGAAFSDLMFGNDGSDFINGGFGSDRINGGADGDRFYHLGIRDHGSDWIQDYSAADGDVLVYGGAANTAVSQFQINTATTANAGVDGVAESFIIYRPTGQILWALVDGDGQNAINLQIGGNVFDIS